VPWFHPNDRARQWSVERTTEARVVLVRAVDRCRWAMFSAGAARRLGEHAPLLPQPPSITSEGAKDHLFHIFEKHFRPGFENSFVGSEMRENQGNLDSQLGRWLAIEKNRQTGKSLEFSTPRSRICRDSRIYKGFSVWQRCLRVKSLPSRSCHRERTRDSSIEVCTLFDFKDLQAKSCARFGSADRLVDRACGGTDDK
jgi:hypothetical protein